MSYMRFSTKLAANLCKVHNLGEDKQAELAYAIEVLTLTLLNIVLVLTLGWIMGVFWGTLTCLVTMAAFRHNAGGGHSESPWRCALATMIVFPLLALAARYVSAWQLLYIDLLALASIILGFVFIIRFAPVDNPKSPIISPVRRQRLKNTALVIMLVFTLIIVGLRFSTWDLGSEIRCCLIFGILWFSINLTSLGKRLWTFIDTI